MEYLQSILDSLLTERVVLGLYRAPFWMWIAAAAGLGALTLWTYWRCFVEVRRREMRQEARDELVRSMAPDVGEDDEADEPGGETHALRYRNWALETRLRAALEAARAGEPMSAEALAQGLDEVMDGDAAAGDDGAPAEAISALKYRNWRLEMRLAQLEEEAAADDDGAEDDADDSMIEDDFDLQSYALSESAEPPSGDVAALLERIDQLEKANAALEDHASGLRYRRWLLARRLGDAVEVARKGSALSIDALLKDLDRDGEAPRFGEPGANPFLAVIAEEDAAPEATAPAARTSTNGAASDSESAAQAASLRYRLWLSQGELRRLRSLTARPKPAPKAPAARSGADKDEAARLRRQLALAEDGLRALRRRSFADTAQEDGRIAELSRENETLRAELETLSAAAEKSERSAEDRERSDALAALLRTRISLAVAEAERLQREKAALEADAVRARTETEGLRAELAEAARRRASAAATLKAAEAPETTAPAGLSRDAATRSAAATPLARPASGDDPQSAVSAALAQAVASPRRGVEDAARELIESGRVVALDSNRPASLSDTPAGPGDALTLIDGVSDALQSQMESFGLRQFRQIAEMAPFDLAWLDDRLGLSGAVVHQRWLPQAELLARFRREGRLRLDANGRYGRPSASAPPNGDDAAPGRATAETAETLPPHPQSVTVDGPFSGAEAAALELLNAAQTGVADQSAPASFSREPFSPEDDLDDLQAIRGVGPKLEAALRALGVGRYRQLAMLSPREAVWLDRSLGLNGRVIHDRWLAQARLLADRAEAQRRAAKAATRRTAPAAVVMASEPARAAAPTTHASDAPSSGVRRLAIVPAREQSDEGPATQPAPSDALSAVEREALRLIEAGLGPHCPSPPGLLNAPNNGARDSLRAIQGVNATLEQLLNDMGVYYYRQLAAFTAEDLAWLDAKLSFRGRVARDRWISQAAALAGRQGG